MKRSLALLFAFVVALPLVAQHARRAFTIEDLNRLKTVSDLDVSPDGKTVVFVVSSNDLPRAKRTASIWAIDAAGGNLRQLTQGESDAAPRFSPDGKTLAFVRDSQLHLLPLGGGEPKKLTTLSTGVADPVWSPDGRSIAFASDVYPECKGDDACNERIAKRWEDGKAHAHVADELLYRHWTAWRDGVVTHAFLVNVADGSVRDLTPGEHDYPPFSLGGPAQFDFAPDSSELAIVSNHDELRASSTNNDLFLISLRGDAKPRNITASNPAYDSSPKYSPDGRFIAYRMQKIAGYESDLTRLALYDRKSGTTRVLTEEFRNQIDDYEWSDDSKSIYFSGQVEGRNPIYRLDVASGAIRKLFEAATIDEFEVAKDGKSVTYIGRSVGSPSEIYRDAKPLTSVNKEVVDEVDIRPAEVMWVKGVDGARVQVFIVKPHGFDPAKKYPLILNVHGGPQMQWSDGFRGDWQVYPGAGYIVAFPNPTGSTGFGQDFTDAINAQWGGRPFDDLMLVTDALEQLPYVDRDRMGAMGWSYGGYMMNWFEGHTDRFKAIASMMGIFDLRSFYGATEELWFPEYDFKGTPWTSEQYEKWSPSNYVKNFRTPCLVITGERDYRVPYTQSLQMFTALQKMNVPSRLIVFENAGHWPSWYEMTLYYTAHLEWFHKYLGGGAPPWTTDQFLRNQVFDAETGKRVEKPVETPKDAPR
jgi:dipeptidyl aminopeptidase/acylaminoacyl peptidase